MKDISEPEYSLGVCCENGHGAGKRGFRFFLF